MLCHCSTRRSWRLRALSSWRACQRLGRLGLMGPGVPTSTLTPDAVQEGVWACDQTQLAGKPRTCLATQSEGYPLQGFSLAVGAAGVEPGHGGQALGEDPAFAKGVITEEFSHPKSQAYRDARPRQVSQRTSVEPMNPARRPPAERTLGRGILRGCMDGHRLSVERELVDVQFFGDGEAGAVGVGVGHEFPPGRVWRDCMEWIPFHLKIGRAHIWSLTSEVS